MVLFLSTQETCLMSRLYVEFLEEFPLSSDTTLIFSKSSCFESNSHK